MRGAGIVFRETEDIIFKKSDRPCQIINKMKVIWEGEGLPVFKTGGQGYPNAISKSVHEVVVAHDHWKLASQDP